MVFPKHSADPQKPSKLGGLHSDLFMHHPLSNLAALGPLDYILPHPPPPPHPPHSSPSILTTTNHVWFPGHFVLCDTSMPSKFSSKMASSGKHPSPPPLVLLGSLVFQYFLSAPALSTTAASTVQALTCLPPPPEYQPAKGRDLTSLYCPSLRAGRHWEHTRHLQKR